MLDEEINAEFLRAEDLFNELESELYLCNNNPAQISTRGKIIKQEICVKLRCILDKTSFRLCEEVIEKEFHIPDEFRNYLIIENEKELEKKLMNLFKKQGLEKFKRELKNVYDYLHSKRTELSKNKWLSTIKYVSNLKHGTSLIEGTQKNPDTSSTQDYPPPSETSIAPITYSFNTEGTIQAFIVESDEFLTSPLDFHRKAIDECKEMIEEIFKKFIA